MPAKQVAAVASDERTGLALGLDRALGAATAKALGAMGMATVGDLLYHFPFRLAHRGELMAIASARAGEAVTLVARVLASTMRPMNSRRGHILNVTISDGTHELELAFFAKNPRPLAWHERRLQPGAIAIFSGTVSSYQGQLQLTHPDYELIADEDHIEEDIARAARPIPIYHASAKMPSWKIAKAVATVMALVDHVPEPLPLTYREQYELPPRMQAIRTLHDPPDDESWERARNRMVHEEAFVLQAVLAQRSAAVRACTAPSCPPRPGGLLEGLDARLPYELTEGQQSVGAEISADLSQPVPMQRLLQGDVGAGKTVVALRAMAQVVDSGYQAALLAPTEVLAQQHYATICDMLGTLARAGQVGGAEGATRVELVTGSLSSSARTAAQMRIASGEAGIIIGTHALLNEVDSCAKLALAVVDEQHRFGVDQRSRLGRSGVHTLVMTATPIPRTMAMSVFGDLEVSTLRQLPAGRGTIETTIVPAHRESWVARAWERASEEVSRSGRVYIVCPRISPGDKESDGVEEVEEEELTLLDGLDAPERPPLASVEETAQMLRATPALASIPIGIMHGRLTADEKAQAMADFASGATPILVCTTVIEVGVDVPEATMMIILDADRFGLSQLHQLRGRIGRGSAAGLCLAMTHAAEGTHARQRLDAFASTTDGFELARRDLELRREGDVLGASQSGRASHLRFLSAVGDGDVIAAAREGASALIASDPTLAEHPDLASEMAALDADQAQYMEKN